MLAQIQAFLKTWLSRPVFIWLIVAISVRVLLLFVYHPVISSDTSGLGVPSYIPLSYHELAMAFVQGDLSHDLGTRSPGYPALMAAVFWLFGVDNYHALWVIQAVLGVLLFAASYYLWSQIFKGPGAALAAVCVTVLDPAVVLSDSLMLSETLTIFLLILSLALLLASVKDGKWHPMLALLCGISLGWLALTRPAFQFLPPMYLTYIVVRMYQQLRNARAVATIALLLVGSMGPILGWNYFNYTRFGYFTMMTTQGYILTSHSGPIIAGHPERYGEMSNAAAILDRYVQKTGWGIWYAYPEIMESQHLSFIDASKQLEKLSFRIFRDHPGEYAKSVFHEAIYFWTPSLPLVDEKIEATAAFRYFIGPVYRIVSYLGYALFALVFIIDLIRPRYWVRTPTKERLLFAGIILLVCAASSITIAAEGSRYKIPLLPLILGSAIGTLVENRKHVHTLLSTWR